jgi:phosphonate transport system substrate-binding protein
MRLVVSAHLSPAQNALFHQKLEAIEEEVEWTEGSDAHLLYLCGLPASHLVENYEPIAAPVLAGERYQNQPWYFVDVVGRLGAEEEQRWAFNQPGSFSGWLAVQHGFQVERRSPSTVQWIETGSHLASLDTVRKGEADRAGVDSMILDLDGTLLGGLEVVRSWGPWPAPPVMALRALDDDTRTRLRAAFASDRGGRWHLLDEDHLRPIMSVERALAGGTAQ